MIPDDAISMVLRLSAAVVVGALVGINRQLRHKPAGLRTHSLVALGAAVVTALVSQSNGFIESHPDAVSRVIQGLITGIGFLGAGVILRSANGKNVHGLTTAGSIWFVACIGAACGLGAWLIVGVACFWVFAVLIGGGPIERWIMNKSQARPEDMEP